MNVAAIVVAAGEGRRFGSPKQFALLGGRSVLEWSLAAFEAHPRVKEIVLVLPDEALGSRFASAFAKIRAVVRGGAAILLAASVFHFRTIRIGELKAYLKERGIEVRGA